MARSVKEALAFQRHERRTGLAVWPGKCLKEQRTAYGVPSKRYQPGDVTAASAFRHTEFPISASVPGALLWWTGGSTGAGHVAMSAGIIDGVLMCYTTDFRRPGHVDVAPVDAITHGWGLHFEGATADINGVRVIPPAVRRIRYRVVRHGNTSAGWFKQFDASLVNRARAVIAEEGEVRIQKVVRIS